MSWPAVALIAIIVFWISLAILLTRWPRTANKSISQHSANTKESFLFFSTVQVVIGFILYLFVIRWFIPTFHLSFLFTIVYSLTAWLQIISTVIPDTVHGRKSSLHQRVANPFAVGMLAVTILLCLTPTIHGWPKLFFYAVAIFMTYCIFLIIPKKGKPHLLSNYLLLQIVYIVSFQAAFLAVTFYR